LSAEADCLTTTELQAGRHDAILAPHMKVNF